MSTRIRMPIPLTAIVDYRNTLAKGGVVQIAVRSGDDIEYEEHVVEAIYSYFVFTKDRKSYLYVDLMKDSGWWQKNKKRYWTEELDTVKQLDLIKELNQSGRKSKYAY